MDIIKINSEQRNIGTIGKSGEHNQTRLDFEIPEKMLDYDIYDIEFELENGKKIAIHEIEPVENELQVLLEKRVLEFGGKCYIQIVAYKNSPETITKTPFYIAFVERSINATDQELNKNTDLVN